jgi:hypothetical protein
MEWLKEKRNVIMEIAMERNVIMEIAMERNE